jgi:hypothetical protein
VEELKFRNYFGLSGNFVALCLLAQAALAIYLGFKAEAAKNDIPTVQVVCLFCVATQATYYFFNSVVRWRAAVAAQIDIQEGRVDPLAALDNYPTAKRLAEYFNDNFAIHTGGKYSLLLVIGAEVLEFGVQALNANGLAGHLDWNILSQYLTLICTNFVIFGICLLADDRTVTASVMIAIDVLVGEFERERSERKGRAVAARASEASAKKELVCVPRARSG